MPHDDVGVSDELFDEFLKSRGHEGERNEWVKDHRKYQCPDCGAIHGTATDECKVCGWQDS